MNTTRSSFSIIATLLIYLITMSLQAQPFKSGKSAIYINTLPVIPDTLPPLIKIMAPVFTEENVLKSISPEITLLGKVTDEKSGINRIFINTEKYEIGEDGLFAKMIPLVKGENKITIIAVDNDDNYMEKKFTVNYAPELALATGLLNVSGKYYALLIGISEYHDPELSNLDYPVKDAESLYNTLVSEYIFDPENVMLLKNVARVDINNALDMLAQRITPEDNLLIFYAGHGWWDEKANIGYWLPSDARRTMKAEWFRNSTLCDYIKEINSKHTLLITDACFGGSIFKTRSVSIEAPKGIQFLYDLPSRKAMTSGTITEVPDRSSFIKYLVDRLEENKEQCLSSEQLFSSFRIAVINNSDIVPQYGEIKNVGDEGGDFIFIRRKK